MEKTDKELINSLRRKNAILTRALEFCNRTWVECELDSGYWKVDRLKIKKIKIDAEEAIWNKISKRWPI